MHESKINCEPRSRANRPLALSVTFPPVITQFETLSVLKTKNMIPSEPAVFLAFKMDCPALEPTMITFVRTVMLVDVSSSNVTASSLSILNQKEEEKGTKMGNYIIVVPATRLVELKAPGIDAQAVQLKLSTPVVGKTLITFAASTHTANTASKLK